MIPRLVTCWATPHFSSKHPSAPMVFLAGPRQVGKTALAQSWTPHYFNWDTIPVRNAYARDRLFFRQHEFRWLAFDEIHKRRDWKNYLKALYDDPLRNENFIVTGSGRFDLYQRGGDSLQGRYELFHLMPLTVDEVCDSAKVVVGPRDFASWQPPPDAGGVDEALIQFGGFPVPFLSQSQTRARRFRDLYLKRLVYEDVRDFSLVTRLDALDMLARLLPSRLTSPLSYQSLATDVETSAATIKSWLRLLEILFLGFRMKPWHRLIQRAVKREPKWYYFDWAYAQNEGAQFENYLAIQLVTACTYWSEQGHGHYEVYYLRDQDRREVDFVITRDLKPVALVEAKTSPTEPTSALTHYCQRLGVPGYMVYPRGPNRRHPHGFCLNSGTFLEGLLGEKQAP